MCVEHPNKKQGNKFLHDPSCTIQCPFIVSFVLPQLVHLYIFMQQGGKESCTLRISHEQPKCGQN